jgi:SAM-dependent MidA family methyltransferase
MWRRLGTPDRFHVIEAGAANGLLADAIREYAREHLTDFAAAMRYVTLDIGGGREAIDVRAHGVPFRGLTGCILAHELWDNLPVRRLVRTNHGWDEIRVGLDGDRVVELREPLRPERFDPILVESERRTAIGAEIELRPALGAWLAEAATALDRGYLLAIDYGYLDQLAFRVDHPRGSVMAYRGQEVSESPLADPGQWDITAHVDFEMAAQQAREAGFDAGVLADQRTFLVNLGLEGMLRGLHDRRLDQAELQRNSLGIRELVRRDGFGAFVVACFAKDAPLDLQGFREQADASIVPDPTVPLMTELHLDLVGGRYPHMAASPAEVWARATGGAC